MLIVSDDLSDYRQLLLNDGIEDDRLHFLSTGRSGSGPNLTRNLAMSEAQG